MVTVKICGLTRRVDAEAAVAAGADYLGFVFFQASRRCVPVDRLDWVRRVTEAPKVGVFRDQPGELVERIRDAAGLDLVQLHGAETPEQCAALGGRGHVIKAVSVGERIDWAAVEAWAAVARILFDTASPTGGGTGRRFDWSLLEDAPSSWSFWLAGGLDPDNVAESIARVRPAGVDVASGVETAAGVKDPARIRAFVTAVRSAGEAPAPPGRWTR